MTSHKYTHICSSMGHKFTRSLNNNLLLSKIPPPIKQQHTTLETCLQVKLQSHTQKKCFTTESENYYHFAGIPTWSLSSSTSLRLPIPKSKCSILTFVWPNINEDSCYCPLLSADIYDFADCARNCESKYDIELLDDTIVLGNLNSSTNFLVHYICDKAPCSNKEKNCFLTSIVSSHKINMDGEFINYLLIGLV